jgi:uncharacterized membrane protein YkvA (DUF1232 family)
VQTWQWTLIGLGGTLVVYGCLVAGLLVAGRREVARAAAGLIPDLVVLVARLLRDPSVPRGRKLALAALAAYLALPFDLVPDFVPVAGQLDDVLLVALVLRGLVRSAGPSVVAEHWPGPRESLAIVLKLAGRRDGQ